MNFERNIRIQEARERPNFKGGATVTQTPALILIIDDIPTNLGVMVDLLETEGHRVLVAKNGTEGTLRAENEQPDLILLDVMMPGENGFAVCRRLKSGATTRHIPVIFMTSLDDLQHKLEGFAAGGVDYVTKPVQIAEVVTRVRTHLELSALRRQLAAQNQQLREARDELEERVRLRTAALTAEVEERRRAEQELQRYSDQIRHMAHHDPLTGLSNRIQFQQRLEQLIAHARHRNESVATMFLDLDQFNQINDSFGHAVGDMVLREIAQRLSHCLRETDALARWGGDEFVVALSTPDVEETSRRTAEAMLEALHQPVFAEKHELHLSGSIGISLYPSDGLDVQTLLRAADTAMYHAKEKGRGTLEFFTPALAANVQHRTSLAALLHGAQARNEIYLQYQPQFDIDSGRVLGAEALMRWRRPDAGNIPPAEFIPIAEDTGLIQTLGEWALRQACEQGRRWHDAGHSELTMAVNLSVRQLADPKICKRVARLLEETGFPPSSLELEITENLLMQPTDEVLGILHNFNDLGIRLTIDDFGIGYSSLSYLQRFPIQSLKIDRSFVNRIGLAFHDDAIVSAIIALAESLHLRVLAEGVETPAQIEFLRERGCRAAQGYFFSWPVDAGAFTELLVKPARAVASMATAG
jgi:diguanylate cyclase (GGDEF)-like protein